MNREQLQPRSPSRTLQVETTSSGQWGAMQDKAKQLTCIYSTLECPGLGRFPLIANRS